MNARIEWTSEDVAHLQAFLKTPSGEKLIPAMTERFPALLGRGDVNAILIRSGEYRGCQLLIHAILELAFPNEIKEVPVSAYPNLEDDTQWPGEKLDPTQPKVN